MLTATLAPAHNTGLFHGITSLLQLIRQTPVKQGTLNLECWEIQDAPRYAWRGFMPDDSRHFFGKEKVKGLLDWMAFYKLNRFHWHLTDQHGWRLEVRQYPRLGLVGGIGNFTNHYAPCQFYTQEDIKEIAAYAAERHITVIPEIDMPGHASAADLAYPEYRGGRSRNYPEFTFNPGKEGTYKYLTNILKEADVLFPSQKIHVEGIAADSIISQAGSPGMGLTKAVFYTIFTFCMVGGYLVGVFCIPKFYFNQQALRMSPLLGLALSLAAVFMQGNSSVLYIAILSLANSLIWPLLWPLCMAGLGRIKNIGVAFLIMGISGGAILPVIYQYQADNLNPKQAYWTFIPSYMGIFLYSTRGFKLK